MAGEGNGGRGDRETGLSRGHRSLAFVGIDGLRDFLAETFFQKWFVVEEIVLGRTSGLEQVNDAFHLWLMMGKVGEPPDGVSRSGFCLVGPEQVGKGDGTKTERRLFQKGSAGLGGLKLLQWIHLFSSA